MPKENEAVMTDSDTDPADADRAAKADQAAARADQIVEAVGDQ